MCKHLPLFILAAFIASGCASTTGAKRVLIGASSGAGVGAASGALLSPNDESRTLNALIFGLGGALVGGVGALLSDTKPAPVQEQKNLRDQEQSLDKSIREFQVLPEQQLPDFVRERLQPIVIEEYIEADKVSEDGSLHEPHKVYRIKRHGELFSKPVKTDGSSQQ